MEEQESEQKGWNYYDMYVAGVYACTYLSEDMHGYMEWYAALPYEVQQFISEYHDQILHLSKSLPIMGGRFTSDLVESVNEDKEKVKNYNLVEKSAYYDAMLHAMQDRYFRVLMELGFPDYIAQEVAMRMPRSWVKPLQWVVNL